MWSNLIQSELDQLREKFNNHKVRKDRNKKLPSGTSSNIAYTLYGDYGGENCLQPVELPVVSKLMEEIGGQDLIRFVSVEYSAKAEAVLKGLGATVTLENVWNVFQAMLPLM